MTTSFFRQHISGPRVAAIGVVATWKRRDCREQSRRTKLAEGLPYSRLRPRQPARCRDKNHRSSLQQLERTPFHSSCRRESTCCVAAYISWITRLIPNARARDFADTIAALCVSVMLPLGTAMSRTRPLISVGRILMPFISSPSKRANLST